MKNPKDRDPTKPIDSAEELLDLAIYHSHFYYEKCLWNRDDIIQEWVLGALEALKRADGVEKIRAYQASYGNGYVLNFLREDNNFRNRNTFSENEALEDYASDFLRNEQERGLDLDDLKSWVRNALKSLPERSRKVLELRHFEGKSLRETAKSLDPPLSYETVRLIEKEALSLLRERMETHEDLL